MTVPPDTPDDGWDNVVPIEQARDDDGPKRRKTSVAKSERAANAQLQIQAAEASGVEYTPDFSDDQIATMFAAKHANDLRHVAAWSKWFIWDGHRWAVDRTNRVRAACRKVCRVASRNAVFTPATAKSMASAKTAAAVERLAESDFHIAATADQWDADPWLLNTPDGVIDLRTGLAEPSRPDLYMTKLTAVAPSGECPTWLTFLSRIMGDDPELIAYTQRLAGYALTGITREHSLAFLYGTGANGKSVFISTISGIMGDYHRSAPIETFSAADNNRHPTELAMLQGARLVTATETEEGRRWAEARIKALTGGDRISARFMRQDFFEFTPQFKLVIAGNHKPGLRSVDNAIRRRFHLVPFSVTIPEAERDADLSIRLRDEWPGILQWMIDGCLQWQFSGLKPPEAVRAATDLYLEGEDAVASWLEECTLLDAQAWTQSTDLFLSWKKWAEQQGEFTGSAKRLAQTLEARGYQAHRKKNGRGFIGLRVKSIDVDVDYDRG